MDEKECLELLKNRNLNDNLDQKPQTILTFAQSIDGFIGGKESPLQLSGRESLLLTHSIRNWADAILVGIGTVLIDRPSLTTRYLTVGRNARPVVIDPRLECPLDAPFIVNQPILFTTERAISESPIKNEFLSKGVSLIPMPLDNLNRLDLSKCIEKLHTMGLNRVMIEGGAKIIQECLTNPKVGIDLLIVTIAPKLIGTGVHAVCGRERSIDVLSMPSLTNISWHTFGQDIVLMANVNK